MDAAEKREVESLREQVAELQHQISGMKREIERLKPLVQSLVPGNASNCAAPEVVPSLGKRMRFTMMPAPVPAVEPGNGVDIGSIESRYHASRNSMPQDLNAFPSAADSRARFRREPSQQHRQQLSSLSFATDFFGSQLSQLPEEENDEEGTLSTSLFSDDEEDEASSDFDEMTRWTLHQV